MRLVVTASAAAEIRKAAAWWQENRPAARELLTTELKKAFELITSFPEIGAVATNPELPSVRRVLLHRTRYHVYYRVAGDAVEILGLWHASRGREPVL